MTHLMTGTSYDRNAKFASSHNSRITWSDKVGEENVFRTNNDDGTEIRNVMIVSHIILTKIF